MRTGLEARIADALVTRLVESRLSEALMDQVLQALAENRNVGQLVIHLLRQPDVNGSVEQLVLHLLQQPGVNRAVDAIVDRQLGRVLQALRESDEVRELVREQVDVYLQYLTAHPEPVRELIQDQSRGMIRNILASVRARAVVADDAVDAWVRRTLGRT